jgi:hypothetical protein
MHSQIGREYPDAVRCPSRLTPLVYVENILMLKLEVTGCLPDMKAGGPKFGMDANHSADCVASAAQGI